MHKSSSTIDTIWWKRSRWSIGEIASRRWSISSCRHIFALRQKVKKNHSIFPQLARLTGNVILCTCMHFNRSIGRMWLREDITTIITVVYLFSLLSLTHSLTPSFLRLLFGFFLFIASVIAAERWCMVNVYTLVYVKKCVFLVRDCMSLRDSHNVFIRGSNIIICTIEQFFFFIFNHPMYSERIKEIIKNVRKKEYMVRRD